MALNSVVASRPARNFRQLIGISQLTRSGRERIQLIELRRGRKQKKHDVHWLSVYGIEFHRLHKAGENSQRLLDLAQPGMRERDPPCRYLSSRVRRVS